MLSVCTLCKIINLKKPGRFLFVSLFWWREDDGSCKSVGKKTTTWLLLVPFQIAWSFGHIVWDFSWLGRYSSFFFVLFFFFIVNFGHCQGQTTMENFSGKTWKFAGEFGQGTTKCITAYGHPFILLNFFQGSASADHIFNKLLMRTANLQENH